MNVPLTTSEVPCLKECPLATGRFARQCERACGYEEFAKTERDELGEHTAIVGWVGHCAIRQQT